MAKKRKRAVSPVRRAGRIFYRAAVVLSAGVVALFLGYHLAAKRPDMAPDPVLPPPPVADLPNQIPEGGSAPQVTPPQRKEGTYTFLLAASDQVSGNADTIMVAMYDTESQTVGILSIPRDTLLREGKINSLYHKGPEVLKDAASSLLGIPIDHYVTVSMRGLTRLVDELGGIDFNVPVRMSYDAPDQDLYIHYEKGMQHLTGADVVKVARCRKNSDGSGNYPNNIYDAYPDADIGRTRTQQQLITAILKKALSNPQKLNSYVEICLEYVDTNLSLGELLWFVKPALGFDFSTGISSDTLPGDGTVRYGKLSWCYQLYPEETLEMVNRLVNPYTTDRTAEHLNIFQVR